MSLRLFSATLVAVPLVMASAYGHAKTLVYCSEASPETFTPMLGVADSTMDAAAKPLFNRLVGFKPGSTEIGPELAESWDLSADGKTYTFHLRKGVKFHSTASFTPTRDFNADDVLYTFNRQRDPASPYHKLGNGAYEYFNGLGLASMIDKIEKIDDNTVKISLKAPNATFLSGIALDYMSIMSLEQADKMIAAGTPELIDRDPAGTGPFKLQAYVQDSQIRYEVNKDYWGNIPKIDNMIFAITPDASTRVERVKANECHIATLPPPPVVDELKRNPDLNVLQIEAQNIAVMGFNLEHAPLDDVRVRTALAKAVNRNAIIDAVFQGSGVVAGSMLPPSQLGAVNDASIDFDPEGAKKLLADAGHATGLTLKLWAMPVARPYNPNARRMAELIQADWEAVGVKSQIVVYEWAEYLKRTAAGEHDVFLLGGTSDNGDPDNMLSYLLTCEGVAGGSNRSRWCDEGFDRLIQEGRAESDRQKRAEIYKEAQHIIKQQVPLQPIARSVISVVTRKTVKNYALPPFGRAGFENVDIEE